MVNRAIKDSIELADVEQPANMVEQNPLLLQLSEAQQSELVAIIMEDYRNALEARQQTSWGTDQNGKGIDFDTKYAKLIELYEGEDVERPEAWMCGRSLKIAQSIVEMLVARLFPAVWNEDTIRWKPVEFTDKKRTQAVNQIMRWVLVNWMKIRKDVLNLTRCTISLGTSFTEPYWSVKKRDLEKITQQSVVDETGAPVVDPATGQPMSLEARMLSIDEKPAIKTIPLTKILTQPGCTDIQKEPVIKLEDYYYHELEQEQREGIVQNVDDKLKAAVDKTLITKFGSELDKAEKIASLNAKRRNTLVETLTWYGPYDANGDSFPEEIVVRVAIKDEIYLQGYPLSAISRRGIRPIVQTNFMNRMFKLLGIGVLEQVKPLAEEIDACFRQLQDANTLGIMKWGFYDPNSDYNPDEHVAKPRAMYPVTNPSQNVYFPDMNVPIERLIMAIRLVLEFIERLTAASSYVMGKESEIVGGSGTATRTQAIVSSADTRFNLPGMNIRDGIAETITHIFDLCHMNMPEGLEKRILGEDNEPVFDSNEDIKAAFMTEMDCYLEPNAAFGDVNTTRELATVLYDKFVMGGNPLVVGSVPNLYHATANVFKAYGENPKEWIGPPPIQKETNDPTEENTIIREGRVISPEPQENHLEHILVHSEVLQTPEIILWSREAVQVLTQHIEEHKNAIMLLMQFQGQGKTGGTENGGDTGGKTASKGKPAATAGQQGFQGNANPAQAAANNQTQGTTLGTPEVR